MTGGMPCQLEHMKTIPGGLVHELPADLAKALTDTKAMTSLWHGLTPTARNEFICWVEYAKQEKTRARRIERTVQELLEGQKRPCCWAGCIHRTDKKPGKWQQVVLMDKMKTFDSFDHWYEHQTPQQKRVITRLRSLVRKVAPTLLETSKWTNGVWQKGDLPLIFIHTEPDHIQFGFFGGAALSDPKKLLRGKGKFIRHIRVEKIEDVDDAVFAAMIRKALKAPAYR